MKYLSIDYGVKRTGLAMCDAGEIIVSPLTVIQGKQGIVLKKIKDVVENEGVESIVLGLPLNMDGSQGFQAKLVIKFSQQLSKILEIPIHFQDERLSTFGAKEKIAPLELTRGKKKKYLDAVAAMEILQAFLEQRAMHH